MKLSARTIITAIIFSIILFFVGQYWWGEIFIAILPIVGSVKFLVTSLNWQFMSSIIFSLTLALIPIATIFIWRFAPIFKTQRKIMTVGIIILAITVSIFVRREMIKYQARHLQPTTVLDYTDPFNPRPTIIESHIPVSTLNFELYALAGLLLGSVVSIFSLRQTTK